MLESLAIYTQRRMSFMFKWDELEALKEAALARDAYQEVIVYQNEQILRELKSMGWKLKEANEKNGI
jgi:hypothetical protein